MSSVTFSLSEIDRQPEDRPRACPYCESQVLQGWGWETKKLCDFEIDSVAVHRYRCDECGRTFRHYPTGVDQADLSIRVRQLAGVLWGLGLRLEQVAVVLRSTGAAIGTSSVWRAGRGIERSLRGELRSRFRPLVADDVTEVVALLQSRGLVVRIKIAPEKTVIIGVIEDGRATEGQLVALTEELGIEARFGEGEQTSPTIDGILAE